jgi:hypothetical protein
MVLNSNIDELFPLDISDEAAFQIVNFFSELALAVESHYFTKLRRYIKDSRPPDFDN